MTTATAWTALKLCCLNLRAAHLDAQTAAAELSAGGLGESTAVRADELAEQLRAVMTHYERMCFMAECDVRNQRDTILTNGGNTHEEWTR